MAHIAITFADQPDGLVDIKVYIEGAIEGALKTPAQMLVSSMLQAAKEQQEADVQEWPRLRLSLTEADSLADLAGTPRPARD